MKIKHLLPLALLIIAFSKTNSQSVDDIINNYISAIGGYDLFNSINTYKVIYKTEFKSSQKSANTCDTLYFKKPDKYFQKGSVEMGSDGQDYFFYSAYDNKYYIPKLVKKNCAEYVNIIDPAYYLIKYYKSGLTMDFTGIKKYNSNDDAYVLKLINDCGTFEYYIDINSYLLNKISISKEGVVTNRILSDYRSVDGYMIPFQSDYSEKELTYKLTISGIQLNQELSDDIFRLSEKNFVYPLFDYSDSIKVSQSVIKKYYGNVPDTGDAPAQINFLEISEGSLKEKFNTFVREKILELLNKGTQISVWKLPCGYGDYRDLEDALQKFSEGYTDGNDCYDLSLDMSLNFVGRKYISVILNEGVCYGNHPYQSQSFFLLDESTLKQYYLDDIFNPGYESTLKNLLFKSLQKTENDKKGITEQAMFDFAKQNNNFYFNSRGLCFSYSPGEISYYAAGNYDLEIQYGELGGILKDEFKQLSGTYARYLTPKSNRIITQNHIWFGEENIIDTYVDFYNAEKAENPPICINCKEITENLKCPKNLIKTNFDVSVRLNVDYKGLINEYFGVILYGPDEIYEEVSKALTRLKFKPAVYYNEPTDCFITIPVKLSN